MTARGTAIHLLGRLAIDREGTPSAAAFSGRRSELVFAYLAAEHRRDVTREELADALWPEELPDAWAPALRGVVSDVRRAIAAGGLDASDVLESTGGGYRLRLPAETVVDLDEARDALATARSLADDDPAQAASEAGRAADLARLPFLPRHEGGWVDGVRRELEEILIEALELSARAHLRAGDANAAAAAAARLVEAEPYSDAAHRLRIEALVAAGNRAGALRAYEQCRETFSRDLGVEPPAELRALWQPAEAAPPSREGAPHPPAAGLSPFAAYAVLVVDDHDFQRRTALALLSRLGVGSLSDATGGAEALELLERSTPPDVIVCDIDMPGMDGVEFIRHVAERRLASAVVIASGLEQSVLQAVEAVGEGYGLQVLGTIEKPLTARRLEELLTAYRRRPSTGDAAAPAEAELESALDEGRIKGRFVPIVDLRTGAVGAAQAVASLRDAAGEVRIVTADEPSTQHATRLTEALFAIAAETQQELAGEGIEMHVWAGISGAVLADVAWADRLASVAREHDADPRSLVLCVGERAVRRRTPAELDVLTRLRVKGFGVCLDDFEGGHAGGEALARIPLTAVALDPVLVSGAAGDRARSGALEQVVETTRARGLPVVGRGCDDASDYELLMEIGCTHVQGDFIAGPLTAGELVLWAGDWQPPTIAGGAA